jgi:predicted nucleic acid-binding Zn ribbon protein
MSKTCKKCGKEIPQDSKKNICESCKNERNGVVKKVLGTAGSIALTVVAVVVTKGKFNPKA